MVRLEAGHDRLDATLPGAVSGARDDRRDDAGPGGKTTAPKQHTSSVGELTLPAGRCQLDFRLRGKVDPSFSLNSIRLEKVRKVRAEPSK